MLKSILGCVKPADGDVGDRVGTVVFGKSFHTSTYKPNIKHDIPKKRQLDGRGHIFGSN